MGTKTISIMDDAYVLLKRKKHKRESFSELIRRIMGKKKDIMQFVGIWKDLDTERMKKNIDSLRKKSTMELMKK